MSRRGDLKEEIGSASDFRPRKRKQVARRGVHNGTAVGSRPTQQWSGLLGRPAGI
jgi:hypothetical protein